ncbi:hypothetical protein HDIA_3357 [Hartmannibacter diazotrophicus]|uniref:Uncharacterized protein n=1 Tax=Hartmannibacter diazotrophicus TaxID=1482074 RepID=A0A2C9D9T2_9HYPH|nr:hypothetical protein [Hartmannibacter diazotrophicus]SON56898.1 hypothetical protein HDIA_3357 [Hartmannibacter diazotrophicus]
MDRSHYGPFSDWVTGSRIEWGVLAAQSQVMLRLLAAIDVACVDAGRVELKSDTEHVWAAATLLDGMIRLVLSDPNAIDGLAGDGIPGEVGSTIRAGLSKPLDAIVENCSSLADDLAADRSAVPLATRFQQIGLHARQMRQTVQFLSTFNRTLLPQYQS